MRSSTVLWAVLLALSVGLIVFGCSESRFGDPRPYVDEAVPVVIVPYHAVHFIDVGQGDSILVVSGAHRVLIDAGTPSAGPVVVEYVTEHAQGQLDYVISTHPHADHVGGLYSVFDELPVGRWFDSRTDYSSQTYARVLATASRMSIPYSIGRAGMEPDMGADSHLRILWPPEQPGPDEERLLADVNNASIVVHLRVGSVSFLLLGDIGAGVERTLVRNYGEELAAEVIKIAHHGSRSSTSEELLLTVRPKIAVISVGSNNPYGHPDPGVLARLDALGIEVYRTDERGTVVVYTDGRRYWCVPSRGEGRPDSVEGAAD